MKFKKLVLSKLLLFATLFHGLLAQTTDPMKREKDVTVTPWAKTTLNVVENPYLKKRIVESAFKVSLDLGEDYNYGKYDFKLNVKVALKAYKGDVLVPEVFPKDEYEIQIDTDHPEAVIYRNMLPYTKVNNLDGGQVYKFDKIELTVNSITGGDQVISPAIRMKMQMEAEHGYDVLTTAENSPIEGLDILSITPHTPTKSVNIRWKGIEDVSHYQLQLLRLYNMDAATAEDIKKITTEIQWEGAFTIELDKRSVGSIVLKDDDIFFKALETTLTIGGGTGFYVMRIRPLGSFKEGGIADSRNWGRWSDAPDDGEKDVVLESNALSKPYFFFTDPDKDKSWIYSRMYTEATGGKAKESIAFANSLGMAKQTMAHLPSSNVTLRTQTIYDHAGRPTLATMAVPSDGKDLTYKDKFVKPEGKNRPYRAEDFDDLEKLHDPEKVDMTDNFKYWSGKYDPQIPDAEGYPYSRSLYSDDGTGRVIEQSGVGARHMLGDQDKGRGRTTRYFWGTASDSELVALFGGEAPAGESVLKTTTVTPDNVAQVTYTSKEGNVLATAVTFIEGENGEETTNPSLLPIDGNEKKKVEVKDYITYNTKIAENAFRSAKRISVLQKTPLDINYSIRCEQVEQLCTMTELNCDYTVQVNVHQLDRYGNIINTTNLIDQNISEEPCQQVKGLEGDYKIVTADPMELKPGYDYYIEKKLVAGNAGLNVSENLKNIELQTIIAETVAGWLDTVACEEMLNAFFVSLEELSTAVNTEDLKKFNTNYKNQYGWFPLNLPKEFFDEVYTEDLKSQYKLNIEYTDKMPALVTFYTPCCDPPFEIPVSWAPSLVSCNAPYIKDTDGDGLPTPIDFTAVDAKDKLETPQDFEGYAITAIMNCPLVDQLAENMYNGNNDQAARAYLYEGVATLDHKSPMMGWVPGEFNQMIYNMLTEKYSCDGTGFNENKNDNPNEGGVYYDACGNKYDKDPGIQCDGDGCTQYSCSNLMNCWMALINSLKEELCVNVEIVGPEGVHSPSKGYQGEQTKDENKDYDKEGEPGNDGFEHDKHFNLAMAGVAIFVPAGPAIVANIISQIKKAKVDAQGLEDAPEPQKDQLILPSRKLVHSFLECTGYRFAKIIMPIDGGEPLSQDKKPGYQYVVNSNNNGPVPYELKTSDNYVKEFKKQDGYYYGRYADFVARLNVADPDGTYFGKRISNPFYAFKYFEYSEAGTGQYELLETDNCFMDPNECFLTDGLGKIVYENNEPKKVPCCAINPNDPNDPNFYDCEEDYQYPNIEKGQVGVIEVDGELAKLIVRDFCGFGRVRCPYDYTSWSCGQRNTFYKTLKEMEGPQVPESEYYVDGGSDPGCNYYLNVTNWYKNENANPDYPGVVDQGDYNALPGDVKNDFAQITMKKDGENYTNFTFVEYKMQQDMNQCESAAEKRRPYIKMEIIQLLEQKCYDIDGCLTPGSENVVPAEDIDKMVDAVVNAIKEQCSLSTFSCEDSVGCRDIFTPKTQIGGTSSELKLAYGMGGYDNPVFCNEPDFGTYDDDKCVTVNSGIFTIKNCPTFVNYEEQVYSNYQYVQWDQATNWGELILDIPSMCPNEKPVVCCPDIPKNGTKGTTFINKSKYKPYDNVPADVKGDKKVISPSKGIKLNIE